MAFFFFWIWVCLGLDFATAMNSFRSSFNFIAKASRATHLLAGKKSQGRDRSARIESVDELFSIGLNRAITLISEAKPGRMSSSEIKNLGDHPEDKKPVRIMKGQYGPYIKYKSLNATIPEDKDPSEITMEEAIILIEKRKEYDKSKRKKGKK